MSSESKPYEGIDLEDLSLSTPMGSFIVLLSIYLFIVEQLISNKNFLIYSCCNQLSHVNVNKNQFFVVGLLLSYFQDLTLPTIPDHDTLNSLH